MFQDEVFWVMTLCSVVVVSQVFRGPYCLHLQGEVACMGETLSLVAVPLWTVT